MPKTNLNTARCLQLKIGKLLHIEPIEEAVSDIYDMVNILVQICEGKTPMEYCKNCARNDHFSSICTNCYNNQEMECYWKE